MWEHLVLEYLQAVLPDQTVAYWRDKAGREVDFVLARRRDHVDAVECKWNPSEFDPAALRIFRSYYQKGNNYLVCYLMDKSYEKRYGSLTVTICAPDEIK